MPADGLRPDCDMPVPAGVGNGPHRGRPLDFPKPASAVTGSKRRSGARPSPGWATAVFLVLVVLFAACAKKSGPAIPTEPPGGALVAFRSHVVAVELAVNQAEWEKGLMNRTTMGTNNGMLFLFPSATGSPFYMKDTLIPLSVAFLQRTKGQTYKVIDLKDMTPCKADPCKLYYASLSYDAALEVNEGWFARNGVHVGSTAEVGRAPTPHS